MGRIAPLGFAFWIGISSLLAHGDALAVARRAITSVPRSAQAPAAKNQGFDAEARLIEVYKLIGQAKTREALAKAEKLTHDHPNFQLAQLVVGDLLVAQTRPLKTMGDVPEATARGAPGVLSELREESMQRLKALRERPPAGAVPAQIVRLSARNRHVIAVDASRSRLYLFENGAQGLKLMADYYLSVGKLGIEKNAEGDLRTPLGVYFITSNLNRRSLKDFYGAGALPINYPNPYDIRRGKTGSGIWLHGTPPTQFARAPKASDGCLVLANPDLQRIISQVEIRTTPVVISSHLQWLNPTQTVAEHKIFEDTWQQWRSIKTTGDVTRTLGFYTPDFNSYGKTLADWSVLMQADIQRARGREVATKDLSILHWQENAGLDGQVATMVVTFSEVIAGSSQGVTKRQYWVKSDAATRNQWKIFFEGLI